MKKSTKINLIYLLITISSFIFLSLTFSFVFIKDFYMISFLKNFYGQICHQIEKRSFFVFSKPMLICSRCSGIFGGFLTLFLFVTFFSSLRKWLDKLNYKIILVFSLPLLIDWILNFIFKVESTNLVRFLTGFLFSIIPVYFINNLILQKERDD